MIRAVPAVTEEQERSLVTRMRRGPAAVWLGTCVRSRRRSLAQPATLAMWMDSFYYRVSHVGVLFFFLCRVLSVAKQNGKNTSWVVLLNGYLATAKTCACRPFTAKSYTVTAGCRIRARTSTADRGRRTDKDRQGQAHSCSVCEHGPERGKKNTNRAVARRLRSLGGKLPFLLRCYRGSFSFSVCWSLQDADFSQSGLAHP